MFRRKFIARLGFASAGLGAIAAVHAGQSRKVTYRIKGFSCITCAVGLDTMLCRQTGVIHCKSSYPDATATIEFDPALLGEDSLKAFISEMGFTAEEAHHGTR